MLTSDISMAAKLLQQGEIVAFPTETVYGLGAAYNAPTSIKRIFETKGRPQDNPLIVHIAHLDQLQDLIDIPPTPDQFRLLETFWPGPLTLVFKKHPKVSSLITGNLDTIAIRMPNHHIARELIHLTGVPLVAPSANPSGRPSPTHHQHVEDYYAGTVPCLMGGDTQIGMESTILLLTHDSAFILRHGAITQQEIEAIIGYPVQEYHPTSNESPRAPGMAYRHYAPRAKLRISSTHSEIQQRINSFNQPHKLGLMLSSETLCSLHIPQDVTIKSLGSKSNLHKVSKLIYRHLIDFDASDVEVILTEAFPNIGLGRAIMDKLHKASLSKSKVSEQH